MQLQRYQYDYDYDDEDEYEYETYYDGIKGGKAEDYREYKDKQDEWKSTCN